MYNSFSKEGQTSWFRSFIGQQLRLFILFPLVLFCFCHAALGQNIIKLTHPIEVVLKRKIGIQHMAGDKLILTELHGPDYDMDFQTAFKALDTNGRAYFISLNQAKKFRYINIHQVEQIWQIELIKDKTYLKWLRDNYQLKLRRTLHDEANDYINSLASAKRFYEDPYFEDYLYTLMNKIHPSRLVDQRPGSLFIKILKDPNPNAISLPNGCIILSTGLLSLLQSEDELVAILSQQMAHFILDHHIKSYNEAQKRQQRAVFWSNFATAVALSGEVHMAMNDPTYIGGDLTWSTSVLASVISQDVLSRLSMVYTHQLEKEADRVTQSVLRQLNYSDSSMATVLQRIQHYYYTNKKEFELQPFGLFPHLNARISALGYVHNLHLQGSNQFRIKTSAFHSHNAWIELWQNANFEAASQLAQINLDNEVATEIDYIAKAVALRRLSNQPKELFEAVSLLHVAKTLQITPYLMVHKEEALCYLKLNQPQEAKFALETYLNKLLELRANNSNNTEVEDEIVWSKQLLIKWEKL